MDQETPAGTNDMLKIAYPTQSAFLATFEGILTVPRLSGRYAYSSVNNYRVQASLFARLWY